MNIFLPMKIYSPVFYMTPYSLGHGYRGAVMFKAEED